MGQLGPDERSDPLRGVQNSTSPIPGPAPYRALKGSEIRLLRVAPGAWDDQVSCTMHYVPLDEGPEYVALSYTWGDPSNQVEILLDGHRHSATQSLFTALRRYRQLCAEGRGLDGFTFSSSDDGSTYIWADALCINQADNREKEREIPRMRDVYTLCSRVCVWLGENDGFDDDAESRAVLEEIERWLGSGSFGADIPRDALLLTAEVNQPLQREIEDHFGPRVDAFLDLWCKLSSRTWFTRVWVIQEAALPAADPILVAGSYLFSFEGFTRIWNVIVGMLQTRDAASGNPDLVHHGALFRSRAQTQDNPIQTEGDPEDRWARFGRAFGDAMVRQGPGGFQATNPHDYLYSMIGLCGGGELLPPDLAPDYQKPFPQVCEDYARCILKATGSVAILGRQYCDLYFDYETELKPWVPDFRASQLPISIKGRMDPSSVSFVGPNENFLKVRGFDVGKIIRVYIPLNYEEEEDDDVSFNEHLRHHHKFLVEVSRERNISPEDAVVNWLESRLVSSSTAWTTKPAVEDLQALYDHYLQQHDDDDDDDGSRSGSLQDSEAAQKFVQLVRKNICGKPGVLCQGGLDASVDGVDSVGREPPKQGDRLLALSGSRCPFLVRPVLTSEGQGYVFLTHCWLYDGDSRFDYTTDDFSLEFYEESEFEDFILA